VLAGILFQLGTMTIFSALAIDFIVRVILHRPYKSKLFSSPLLTSSSSEPAAVSHPSAEHNNSPGSGDIERKSYGTSARTPLEDDPRALRHVEWLLAGVAFASLMIYVRGVYRAIELAQGWTGYLITHEDYFIYLDGLPMVLCYYAFGALHPGFLLPRRKGWKKA
jgi:hypothetical protein